MGVVTGIPMEFQFGTNWARFSKAAGGVIGQTLAWSLSADPVRPATTVNTEIPATAVRLPAFLPIVL
jgi:hypothetical protein